MKNVQTQQKEVQTMQTFKKVAELMELTTKQEKNTLVLIVNQWGGFFIRIFVYNPSNPWTGYIQDYINQKETQVHVERLSSKTLYIPLNLKEQLQTTQPTQPQEKPQPQTQETSQTIKLKSFKELAEFFSLDLDLPEEEIHENNLNSNLISNIYFTETPHPLFFKKEIVGILLRFHRQKTHAPATTEVASELYMFDYEEQAWKVSRIYASLEFVKDWSLKTEEEIEETIRKIQRKQRELSKEFAKQMYEEYLNQGLITKKDFEKVLKAYEEHPEIFIQEVPTEEYHEVSQILDSEQEEKQIEREKRLYMEEMNEIWEGYIAEIEEIENQIELLKNELHQKTKEINIEEVPEEFREDAQSILKGLTDGYEKRIRALEKRKRRLLKEYRILKELYAEALRYYYIDESQAYDIKDLALKTLQKLK